MNLNSRDSVVLQVIPNEGELSELCIRGKAGSSSVRALATLDEQSQLNVCTVSTVVGAVLSGFRSTSVVKSQFVPSNTPNRQLLKLWTQFSNATLNLLGLHDLTQDARAAKDLRDRILTIWFDGRALCFGGPMIESRLGRPFRLEINRKDLPKVAELFQSSREIELANPKKIGREIQPEIGFSLRAA